MSANSPRFAGFTSLSCGFKAELWGLLALWKPVLGRGLQRSCADPPLCSSRACLHTAFIAFSVPIVFELLVRTAGTRFSCLPVHRRQTRAPVRTQEHAGRRQRQVQWRRLVFCFFFNTDIRSTEVFTIKGHCPSVRLKPLPLPWSCALTLVLCPYPGPVPLPWSCALTLVLCPYPGPVPWGTGAERWAGGCASSAAGAQLACAVFQPRQLKNGNF